MRPGISGKLLSVFFFSSSYWFLISPSIHRLCGWTSLCSEYVRQWVECLGKNEVWVCIFEIPHRIVLKPSSEIWYWSFVVPEICYSPWSILVWRTESSSCSKQTFPSALFFSSIIMCSCALAMPFWCSVHTSRSCKCLSCSEKHCCATSAWNGISVCALWDPRAYTYWTGPAGAIFRGLEKDITSLTLRDQKSLHLKRHSRNEDPYY